VFRCLVSDASGVSSYIKRMSLESNLVSLPRGQQMRNLLVFAACTGLQYLAAPINYVGLMQAPLFRELGATDSIANLPATFYLGLTFSPVIFAWLIPYISWLKRNLVACYAATAAAQALVAMCLHADLPDDVKIVMVIGQSALFGITGPAAIAFLWEILGRGTDESRRGLALGLAFGVGPVLAVLGSRLSGEILAGSLGIARESLIVPRFAILYAFAAMLMALAAILSSFVIVPRPQVELDRRPFTQAVFGGLLAFLRNPVLRAATIVTIALYAGNTIISNMSLYSEQVYGDSPSRHAGQQSEWRFAFKMVAGLALGRLLTQTNPKVGLLATGSIFLSSVLFAMIATADNYILVFGLYGAGELIGVYAPNYILSASGKNDMRRNLAFVTMMMAPAAPAGYVFGLISETAGEAWNKTIGYQLSFAACAAIMLAGLLLAAIRLPARPRPEAGDQEHDSRQDG